jgi:hypothetical protein
MFVAFDFMEDLLGKAEDAEIAVLQMEAFARLVEQLQDLVLFAAFSKYMFIGLSAFVVILLLYVIMLHNKVSWLESTLEIHVKLEGD